MSNPTEKPVRSIRELASEALAVQNACNLSGVVNGFSRALEHLRAQPDARGNDWLHAHPVTLLWADKIASLTGTQVIAQDAVMAAYRACHNLAK